MAEAKILFSAQDQTKPAVDSVNRGLRTVGTTAVAVSGQTQQALRMLPAQITDIVTGLASGQAPLTVLIQQGGQLKDMFGGVGAAAQAVRGYISGMAAAITPAAASAGVLAAAVGVLGVAWHQASEEGKAATLAIISSGNAAGVTSGQLGVMAQRVGAVVGTTGQAAEALAMLVASGQIPKEHLERYATLVARLDRVGISAKETVSALASMGRDPVAGILHLNDSMNFLEASTFRQIKALADLGKTQEAVDLAQKTFADAQAQRAAQMEEALGRTKGLWTDIATEAAKAWNILKDLFRDTSSPEAQVALLQRDLAERRQRNASLGIGGTSGDTAVTRQLQQQLDSLQQQAKVKADIAAADAKRADQTKAALDFEKLVEGSLSRQEKTAKEIERARNLGAASGADQASIDKVVGNISYEDTKRGIDAQISRLKTAGELLDVRVKAAQSEINARRAMGTINERAATEQTFDAELGGMRQRLGLLQQTIGLKSKERDSEKEVADLRGQAEVLGAQIGAKQRERGEALMVLDHQRETAIYAVVRAEQEQFALERDLERVAADKRFNQAELAVQAYAQSIRDANEQLDLEASLLGKSADEQARLNERQRINNALREQKRQIEERGRGGNLTADEQRELNENAEAAAAVALSRVDTRVYIDKWKSVNAQVADSLYDVLTGKGKDAADRLKDIFGDLVLRPILQPVANSITSSIMGNLGQAGGAAGAFGGAGGLGGLGSLGSLAGGLGGLAGIGTAFTAGSTSVGVMAGSIAGGGGLLGGAASALAAIGPVGWGLLAAGVAASLFGGKGGGPKTESGFGSGVPSRGDPSAARTIVKGIQEQYASILGQVGVKGGALDLGVFSAADPKGTAQTQLALTAGLNGRSIYSREARTGGIENVGRSQEELQAAIAEDSTRAVFAAIKATDGLSSSMKAILATTDAYSSSIDDINATMTRAVAAETQRRQIEEQIFALTHSDAENLAHQRQLERDALDDTNKAMADRLYALQDQKKAEEDAAIALQDRQRAEEEAAAAIQKAQQSAAAASKEAIDTILGVVRDVTGYLDKLNATSAGLLSPQDQLSNARSQFDRQVQLARGGNAGALQSLTSYADQYIQAQTAFSASGAPTQDAINYVRQTLGGFDYAGVQGALAQQNAQAANDTGQQQVELLNQLLSVLATYAQRDLSHAADIAQGVGETADALRKAATSTTKELLA